MKPRFCGDELKSSASDSVVGYVLQNIIRQMPTDSNTNRIKSVYNARTELPYAIDWRRGGLILSEGRRDATRWLRLGFNSLNVSKGGCEKYRGGYKEMKKF